MRKISQCYSENVRKSELFVMTRVRLTLQSACFRFLREHWVRVYLCETIDEPSTRQRKARVPFGSVFRKAIKSRRGFSDIENAVQWQGELYSSLALAVSAGYIRSNGGETGPSMQFVKHHWGNEMPSALFARSEPTRQALVSRRAEHRHRRLH